jgi:hypothetical protein
MFDLTGYPDLVIRILRLSGMEKATSDAQVQQRLCSELHGGGDRQLIAASANNQRLVCSITYSRSGSLCDGRAKVVDRP